MFYNTHIARYDCFTNETLPNIKTTLPFAYNYACALVYSNHKHPVTVHVTHSIDGHALVIVLKGASHRNPPVPMSILMLRTMYISRFGHRSHNIANQVQIQGAQGGS